MSENRLEGMRERMSRSAPSRVYGNNGFGAVSSNGYAEIPTLTFRSKQPPSFTSEGAANPFTAGPVFEVAFRIGALPLKVFSFGEGGVKSPEPAHPAYKLLRRPNPDLTRSLMIASTVQDMIAGFQQRSFWLKERLSPDEAPFELWPLDSQIVTVNRGDRTLIKDYTISPVGVAPYTVKPSEIVDFRLLTSINDKAGTTSPLVALMKLARMGSSAIDALDDLFNYALFGSDWIDMGGATLSKPALQRLQEQIRLARQDKYAVPILEDGAELKGKPAPTDDVIGNALAVAEQIVRRQLGLDSDDDTRFLSRVVQPICDAMEQELERSLMPDFDGDVFPEFGFRDQLKGDPKAQADLANTRILSGVWNIDEARAEDNKPPLPDGDGQHHYLPLNVDPVDAQRTGRPNDTSGGLGGDQGKGTIPTVPGQQRSKQMRTRADRWSAKREKTLKRHVTALSRRMAGLLNAETKDLKDLLTHPSERAAQITVGLPAPEELSAIARKRDQEMRDLLDGFMAQTGSEGWIAAADLVSAQNTEVSQLAVQVLATRANIAAGRFTLDRVDSLDTLLQDARETGATSRELASSISDLYGSLKTHLADGIARTELAFSYEQSSLLAWSDAGISEFDFIFGGGPCSTGVCEEAAAGSPYRLGEEVGDVGASFDGADAAPLHPSCTCFTIPFVPEGAVTE